MNLKGGEKSGKLHDCKCPFTVLLKTFNISAVNRLYVQDAVSAVWSEIPCCRSAEPGKASAPLRSQSRWPPGRRRWPSSRCSQCCRSPETAEEGETDINTIETKKSLSHQLTDDCVNNFWDKADHRAEEIKKIFQYVSKFSLFRYNMNSDTHECY